MAGRQVVLCIAAVLLLAASCHAKEDPKKGGLVRKAVAEIIKKVNNYPDYTLFINDIKIASELKNIATRVLQCITAKTRNLII